MAKREVIIKRNFYESLLDKNTDLLKKGSGKSIALLGHKKSGKTFLVREYQKNVKGVIPVYIDFEKISLTPENFSVEFAGNIIFGFLDRPLSDYKSFLSLDNLLKFHKALGDSYSSLTIIENELLKIKPDQKLLVKTAFDFAGLLGKNSGKKFLVALDNFESVLELNNFSQIKDVIPLVNFNDKNASFIVTSSAVKESLSLLKNIDCYEIKNLDKKETFELIEKVTGKKDVDLLEKIFSFTNGHIYNTILISRRYNEEKDVDKAFLKELLSKESLLYSQCKNSINYYYNRARGQTLLKLILKVVANSPLRLSEIARKIYRSAPVTKSILERLIDVDIIHKKDNRFYFSDNVLRLWVKLTSMGYEFDDDVDDRIIEEVKKEL